jgi:hypothetical protein
MILYVTKETFTRFKLKMPEEMSDPISQQGSRMVLTQESGDRLLEWGGKLFYFDRRKCIQVVNFASKLTFVLCDIKLADLPNVGNLIAIYLLDLYADDTEMVRLLKRLFQEHPMLAFSHLKDRSMISTLNRTQLDYLYDGDRLYDYIQNGILHTNQFNLDLNRNWIFTQKVSGKTEYFVSAERFEELLKARYADGI